MDQAGSAHHDHGPDAWPGCRSISVLNEQRVNDSARLWDADTQKVIAEWTTDYPDKLVHGITPFGAAFSPDSRARVRLRVRRQFDAQHRRHLGADRVLPVPNSAPHGYCCFAQLAVRQQFGTHQRLFDHRVVHTWRERGTKRYADTAPLITEVVRATLTSVGSGG